MEDSISRGLIRVKTLDDDKGRRVSTIEVIGQLPARRPSGMTREMKRRRRELLEERRRRQHESFFHALCGCLFSDPVDFEDSNGIDPHDRYRASNPTKESHQRAMERKAWELRGSGVSMPDSSPSRERDGTGTELAILDGGEVGEKRPSRLDMPGFEDDMDDGDGDGNMVVMVENTTEPRRRSSVFDVLDKSADGTDGAALLVASSDV